MNQTKMHSAEARVEGRVAQLLNERELVINIGSDSGVKAGMKFAVLSSEPLEVRDPTSHEVLDVVDREKVRVEAREVRPKVTICRTYRTYMTPGINIGIGIDFAREEVENLRADKASLPPALKEEESYVKINDRVVQVVA